MTDHSADEWVRRSLRPGWDALYRVVLQDGQPVIGEVRIVPSGDAVPPGGIDAVLVRGVQLRGVTAAMVERARSASGPVPAGWAALIRKPSKRMRPEERTFVLAVTAYGYTHAVQAGSPSPVADVASQLDLPRDRVSERLRAARHEGLLTDGPGQGRAAGEVTAAGMDAINGRVARILAWLGIEPTGNLHVSPGHEAEGLASAARMADLYDRHHPGLSIAEVLELARERFRAAGLPPDYQPTSLQMLPTVAATFTPAE